jgi:hypothetical protein
MHPPISQPRPPANPAAYETDFHAWTLDQAARLRASKPLFGNSAAIDIEHIAEELKALGRSEEAALESSYRVLLLHLLKWHFQPERRAVTEDRDDSRSWPGTIVRERDNLVTILRRNPGLKSQEAEAFHSAYPAARRGAAAETGLPLKTFPKDCPWTLDQVRDHRFPADLWPAEHWEEG